MGGAAVRSPAAYPLVRNSDPLELHRIRRSIAGAGSHAPPLSFGYVSGNIREQTRSRWSQSAPLSSTSFGRSTPVIDEDFNSTHDPYADDEHMDHVAGNQFDDEELMEGDDFTSTYLIKNAVVSVGECSEKGVRPPQSFVYAGAQAIGRKWTIEDSPCLRILQEVKQEQLEALNVPFVEEDLGCVTSVGATLEGYAMAGAKKPVDAALFMGRSFRVGWSSSGKIVHAGNIVFASRKSDDDHDESPSAATIHVEKVDCIAWSKEMFPDNVPSYKTLARFLTAVFDYSEKEVRSIEEDSCALPHVAVVPPQWRLPRADTSRMDEYLQFVNMLKKISECYPDEIDYVEQADSEDDAPIRLPRHHPCWVIAKIISFFDASCGQEDLFLERIRNGREMLGSRNCSMMPLCEGIEVTTGGSAGGGSNARTTVHFDDDDSNDRHVTLWERRREAMSQWLQRTCEDPNGVYISDLYVLASCLAAVEQKYFHDTHRCF